jgi:uncharacterized membrane protein
MAKKGKHPSKNSSKQEQDKELLSAEGRGEFAVDSLPPEIKEAIGKIETLPPEQRKTICKMYSMRYEAPLPPPDLLHGYEQVLPGAAERIFAMTEQEALHRRAMERRVITLDGTAQLTGLVSALVVALACIGGGVWAILAGHALAGSFLGGGTLASLVGAFIYGSNNRQPMPPTKQLPEEEKQKK